MEDAVLVPFEHETSFKGLRVHTSTFPEPVAVAIWLPFGLLAVRPSRDKAIQRAYGPGERSVADQAGASYRTAARSSTCRRGSGREARYHTTRRSGERLRLGRRHRHRRDLRRQLQGTAAGRSWPGSRRTSSPLSGLSRSDDARQDSPSRSGSRRDEARSISRGALGSG